MPGEAEGRFLPGSKLTLAFEAGFFGDSLFGDMDLDIDVDADDFAVVEACLTKPDDVVDPSCKPSDFDNDGDVDLVDNTELQHRLGVVYGDDLAFSHGSVDVTLTSPQAGLTVASGASVDW